MTTILDAAVRRTRPPLLNANLLGVVILFVLGYGLVPLIGSDYLMDAVLTPFLALALAAVGLNVLTGYAGQVSLGSAAFLAVGAYAAYNLHLRVPELPLLADIVLAGVVAALFGIIFGLPSLRLRGFYLAVSTLAAQFFVQWALTKFGWFSNDNPSGVIDAPVIRVGHLNFTSATGRYVFSLTVVVVATALTARLLAAQAGRNFVAVRDHEVAAKVIGVPLLRTKLLAFAVSSFLIGVAGVLWAFAYLRTVEPAGFNLDRSFQILFIIIIGGLASLRGAFVGAAFVVVFPLLLSRLGAAVLGSVFDSGVLEMSQRIVIGALIILFLIAEPRGLIALLDRAWAALRSRQATDRRNQTTNLRQP